MLPHCPLLFIPSSLLFISSLLPYSSSSSLLNSSFPYEDDFYFSGDRPGPQITRHSPFSYSFRLGYKLVLSCEAEGTPRPRITWYKNGAEITPFKTLHIRERILSHTTTRSLIDIDPTTLADQAVYGCLASNTNGYHLKSIKATYTY